MSRLDANNDARFVTLAAARYKVDRNWLNWSESFEKGFVSQIAINSRNELFVLNRGNPVIQIFDNEGNGIRQFRSEVVSHGHGIFIANNDHVYVVDSDRHCVHKFSPTLELLLTIGEPDHPRFGLPFNHPTDVAVNESGELFVSDGYGNSHIHKFSATGEHIITWGAPGVAVGEFSNPHSIWLLADGSLLITDRENNRVERYSQDGNWIDTFCRLHQPTEICQGPDGTIYITDLTPRISAYSPDGSLIGRCRTFGAVGHGVAVDSTGDVYVADMMPSAISRFRILS